MKSSKGYQVVLNDCYGGFGLSKDAVSMLIDKYMDIDSDYGYVDNDVFMDDNIDSYRMDKRLIDVVKSLEVTNLVNTSLRIVDAS